MSFHMHGRGIHIVCSPRRPGTSSHGSVIETLQYHEHHRAPGVPVRDQNRLSGIVFMVLIGGIGTIEGPVLGALVLFGLQEALSSYSAWYLVIVGGLAVAATLVSPRGLWGFAADRFGWSLFPVGSWVRPPRG
jgi:hypothetical protein